MLGQHWPWGTGAIEPSVQRSTMQRTCSKRGFVIHKSETFLGKTPGNSWCCRTQLCSDSRSFVGLEPGLRWGISDDRLKDKNTSHHDLRITNLWRARYALAVLQWTEVPGGTAFALRHRGKFSVGAELGTSDIQYIHCFSFSF